ncbi:MAG: hypothetical protein JRM88_06250 [Nitrososphaerota archaeon]|jgi:hypothetical protein|nr:hypothetical protein [Nitrososphaerota archaeon]MDG6949888.1 hypothetical protein [Nitrososphaerota archaeon]
MVDLLSLPLGAGQAVGSLMVLTDRLKLYLRRKQRKKEIAEQVHRALNAIDSLAKAQKALSDSGSRLVKLIDETPVPVPVGMADHLYDEYAVWMVSLSADLLSLVNLASQARNLSKYETLMHDLKIVDKPVYELVMMLSRSYEDGKLDLREFPTFLALYGPHVDDGEARAYIEKEVTPRVAKIKRLMGRLPPPFRRRLPSLKKAALELAGSQKSIAHLEETQLKALTDALPGWMSELAMMLSDAMEDLQKVRPGFRK